MNHKTADPGGAATAVTGCGQVSPTSPEASGLALVILPAELNGLVATLKPHSGVLLLDPAASREEQLEAVAGAAAYLLRGEPGRRGERQLRVVDEVGR